MTGNDQANALRALEDALRLNGVPDAEIGPTIRELGIDPNPPPHDDPFFRTAFKHPRFGYGEGD